MGDTQWLCFIVKDKKSCHVESFGEFADKFQLNLLPKPIAYHKIKNQGIRSRLHGT